MKRQEETLSKELATGIRATGSADVQVIGKGIHWRTSPVAYARVMDRLSSGSLRIAVMRVAVTLGTVMLGTACGGTPTTEAAHPAVVAHETHAPVTATPEQALEEREQVEAVVARVITNDPAPETETQTDVNAPAPEVETQTDVNTNAAESGATVVYPTRYGHAPHPGARRGPPRIVQSNVTVGPSYNRAIIQRVVRRNLAPIRSCYERAISELPDLAGSMRARFTIATDGTTERVELTRALHPKVDGCVISEIATWRFPRPRSPLTVVYPFVFSPRAATPALTPAPTAPTPAPASANTRSAIDERPTILGSLDRDAIGRVARAHQGDIRQCYETALQRDPPLRGVARARIVISPRGEVRSASIAEGQGIHPDVDACIETKIRRWRFPDPPGGGLVIVVFPFVFQTS